MSKLIPVNTTESDQAVTVDDLRAALADALIAQGAIRTPRVEAAFRTVPRHLFLPGISQRDAYANQSVVMKRDANGVALSSVSQPAIVAMQLEQAALRPGERVGEIGSGGYNAALICELVGDSGAVSTCDIDPDVIDRTRAGLNTADYPNVNVYCADAEFGIPGNTDFDVIMVTVGVWDIPPAWTNQLTAGGRIVVPLRMRGLTRSLVLHRDSDHLASSSVQLCGFVSMQGAGEFRERLVLLHGEDVGLRLDDTQQVDAEALRAALVLPRAEVWSGVTVARGEPFDNLDLWLASVLPDFALMAATPSAHEAGTVAAASPLGIPTLIDGDSFAYRTARPVDAERTRFELGACGHGAAAAKAAECLSDEIRTWNRDHRAGPGPAITVHPFGTPDAQLPAGFTIDKKHTRVTISWPND